jgi:serine/threonine-protein kinase
MASSRQVDTEHSSCQPVHREFRMIREGEWSPFDTVVSKGPKRTFEARACDSVSSGMGRGAERIGQTIRGKYRVDSLIGEGGMAVVYAATHRNNKRFALKMLHPELSFHEDTKQRFTREGYVANTVGHVGAVAVVDDDVAEDGSAFIVMELLDGEGLDAFVERSGGRLAVDAALAITDQLLDVLRAAHAKGIVHRDLKPANLFLTREGNVKVLDFGIARLRDVAGGVAATQTGALMGTPAFLPPEQAMGRNQQIDAQTDLWAVGATLFTLLSGQYVHVAESPAQMVVFAATQRARSLAEAAPNIPPAVVQLVDRALLFDKEGRWASAEQMQTAVREAYVALYGAYDERVLRTLLGAQPASRASALAASVAVAPAFSGFGGTTAKPVQADVSDAPRRPAAGAKRMVGIALGVLALAALGTVSIVAITSKRETSRHDVATAIASSTAPLASSPPEVAASTPVVASSSPSSAVSTVAAATTRPKAVASTTPPPTTNCHIVTSYDETHTKHFKEVCN